MSKINIMSEDLSNKIAAGEVVEKTMNVVKELVENSIDAKASMIKVELKDSGVLEIKVTDDGIGMDKEDAVMCFSRHATSKLHNINELFNIASLLYSHSPLRYCVRLYADVRASMGSDPMDGFAFAKHLQVP